MIVVIPPSFGVVTGRFEKRVNDSVGVPVGLLVVRAKRVGLIGLQLSKAIVDEGLIKTLNDVIPLCDR